MSRESIRNMGSTLSEVRKAVSQGVVDAANEIRRVSVAKTPVDTGFLRKSAEIYIDGSASTTMHTSEHTRSVGVRYSAPYAGYVHNASGHSRGKPRHPPHRGKYWDPSGSEPRFLENAMTDVLPRLPNYIQRRIQEVLRG